ncbi:MAG TPA: phage tail sheath C-terminal domain-containing protein [Puia sp.]
MAEYKTPGVYIEEIPHLPPSVASVPTAIPAFIGYTQKAPPDKDPGSPISKPVKISSIFEYELYYGTTILETDITVLIDLRQSSNPSTVTKTVNKPVYHMYYQLQMFYANGGGDCYIVSVGSLTDGSNIGKGDFTNGLTEILKIRDVTLISMPDAVHLGSDDYYSLQKAAIDQCVLLQDRFTVMDVWIDDSPVAAGAPPHDNIATMRNATISTQIEDRKYGAVYYPRIYSQVNYLRDETKVTVTIIDVNGNKVVDNKALASIKSGFNNYYNMALNAIDDFTMLLPVSPSVLGVYTTVDDTRGVWKAPANVGLSNTVKPERDITNHDQESLNVDPQDGKSINVIRSFPGRGSAIVWGARTLLGNDNEWRYVSVRRFFIMVEQSVKNATEQFVFEPNDEHTWLRLRSMIEIYLTRQWKDGALMGSSTKEAFFVHIGLGQTMTEEDIWEGRLIIQIGMAAVRPAEFIILQFMHKMLSES